MITNKDLEIENISYTNKDFGQIYPELLDLVKKLTNKWDPESTNESDPGIVLLKLIAFLGDKLNYNIDKNTLEQFIVSATQEISMRRLTEMLGYNMKYYRSATTKVSFRYLGELGNPSADQSDVLARQDRFYVKAFDTTFKTEDDIVYTLLEDLYVDKNNRVSTGKLAIQGELKVLSVLQNDNYNSSTLIQLYNLDAQNRLYFPDVEVAENGIFINKEIYDAEVNPDAWHRVDNLNDQDLLTKVFKFGFDSNRGFPYIEFPKDIADLIEDGLEVYYIVSSGENGKVTNNKLTKFNSIKITIDSIASSQPVLTSLDESIYVLANSSSTEAYDPETLTEAYNNFKKVVGTFNTLVSCRDYSNYINTYEDSESEHLVSNVVASDIRTDPEYTKVTFIRDASGNSYYDNVISSALTGLEYYNVILHGTMPVNQEIQSQSQYDKTYQPLSDSNLIDIETELQDVKTINHNLVKPGTGDLNIIEADYTLKANIATKYKVNSTEQKQIINNIKLALYKNFNARQVEFGEEIPYESLLETIENADTRIKNVSLDEPDIIYYLSYSGLSSSSTKVAFDPETHTGIIIDNVRAGSLPLYGEDTSFSYDYTMDLSSDSFKTLDKLCALSAKVKITQNHKLRKSEAVQLIEDSYIAKVSYPAYVYYAFNDPDSEVGSVVISANQTYKLLGNQKLYIHYTDSSNVKRYLTYKEGDIIKPNFDIVNTQGVAKIDSTTATVEKKTASKFINWEERTEIDLTYATYSSSTPVGVIPLYSIGTNEQIDILKRHEITLAGGSNAFWYIKPKVDSTVLDGKNPLENPVVENPVVNEAGNIIFKQDLYDSSKYYYILEEGELFIYPNDDMTSLNILGAGTKLEYSQSVLNRVSTDIIDLTELENSIEDEDVGTFRKSFVWQTVTEPLTVVESNISTFIENDNIDSFIFIENDEITDEDKDKITDEWKKLKSLTVNQSAITISEQTRPLIRSVLSITSSSAQPQKIESDQAVICYRSNIEEETGDSQATITASKITDYIQAYPDIDSYNNLVVLQGIKYDEDEGKLKPQVDSDGQYLHTFENYSIINYKLKTTPTTYTKSVSDLILYLINNNKKVINNRDEYVISHDDLETYFTQIPPESPESSEYILTINSDIPNMYFNVFDTKTGNTQLLSDSYKSTGDSYNSTEDSEISIDVTTFIKEGSSSDMLYITKPKILKIYNYLSDDIAISIIGELKKITNYDWIGYKNPSKIIDSYTPLYSFFNPNNVYNRFTLPKIDFESSEFNIAGSSKV